MVIRTVVMVEKPKRLHICGCGWYRDYTPRHENRRYNHPIYGNVTGIDMARLDISTHECRPYMEAVLRHGKSDR